MRKVSERGIAAAAAGLALLVAACGPRPDGPAPVISGEPAASAEPVQVKVRPGQTLSGISHTYHVPMTLIAEANHLAPPYRIEAGRTMVIPQPDQSSLAAAAPAMPPQSAETAAVPAAVPLERTALPPAAPPPATAATPSAPAAPAPSPVAEGPHLEAKTTAPAPAATPEPPAASSMPPSAARFYGRFTAGSCPATARGATERTMTASTSPLRAAPPSRQPMAGSSPMPATSCAATATSFSLNTRTVGSRPMRIAM